MLVAEIKETPYDKTIYKIINQDDDSVFHLKNTCDPTMSPTVLFYTIFALNLWLYHYVDIQSHLL